MNLIKIIKSIIRKIKINKSTRGLLTAIAAVVFLQTGACVVAAPAVGDLFPFPALTSYCANPLHAQECEQLPAAIAPKLVIVIHGMNAAMDSRDDTGKDVPFNGSYVRMLSFLEDLGKNDPNYHVYGIDYNSNGVAPGAQPVKLEQLTHHAECSAQGGWKNCWTVLEQSSSLHTPTDLTIRTVSEGIREVLLNAVKDKIIKPGEDPRGVPTTIIAHSMGGLVARDLLYNGDAGTGKTGYELLKNAGIWVNEYVSLGTPHVHGFFKIDDYRMTAIAQSTECLGALDAFKKFGLPVPYQFCMLEQWTKAVNSGDYHWSDGKSISISKLDFPQIHWVFVSGMGLDLMMEDPGAVGDGMVDYRSAQYQLTPGDTTPRADNRLFLNEYPDDGNFFDWLNNKVGVSGLPGQSGFQGYDDSGRPVALGFSGFAPFTNVAHTSLVNVGYYYGGYYKSITDHDLTKCSYDGTDGSTNPSALTGCTGYFQYVIPSTSMCKLGAYQREKDAKNIDVYTRDPQFYPDASEHGITGFKDQCTLQGMKYSR